MMTGTAAPMLDIDPFATDFLTDPYSFHESLREAGAVARLGTYGIWSMVRHAQVHAALTDWRTFSSARGVGIDDFKRNRPWRPPSLVLEVDPPVHTRTHGVLARVMSPGAMQKLRDGFQRKAEALVDRLVERGCFDAVTDLAEVYPLQVFPDAVGLQEAGRENLLPFGNMVFNSFGPRNALFTEAVKSAEPVVQWIFDQCARDRLSPDGFGAQIWAACDAGEISADEAPVLVRSLLTAGLDTTVNGLGNALFAFATHPDQWDALRDDPSMLRRAFDEVLRWESPVQTFFRTTTRSVDVEGVTIPEGEKVLLFLAAANRDPRRFKEPARFDIRRRTAGHVAFGTGIHACVGQPVARLEAELVLGALVRRVKRIELAGQPTRRLNNTLRSLASLPVMVVPA